MNIFEKLFRKIRHWSFLENQEQLWNCIRPAYNAVINFLQPNGVVRNINESDTIRIQVKHRSFDDVYEPQMWGCVMSQVRSDSVVVDVGAYIGFYAIAIGKRIGLGGTGKVYAFEPDAQSYADLRQHLMKNKVELIVDPINLVVTNYSGEIEFEATGGSTSKINKRDSQPSINKKKLPCTSIDSFFSDQSIDLLLMDVEGAENLVLEGAIKLLQDPIRRPKNIFIEVHPYAWQDKQKISDEILKLLMSNQYHVIDLSTNATCSNITTYGHIWAKQIVER